MSLCDSAKMSSPNSAAFTLAANRRRRGTGQPPSSPISSPPSPGERNARRFPRLSGAAAAAASLGAAPLLRAEGKAFFSSDAAVQGFAPVQGLPSVSFHPSSSAYATYTSAAAVALQPPFLAHLCAAIKGIAATDSVTQVQFTQLAMALPPPRVLGWIFPSIHQRHSNHCLLCLSHQLQRSAHLHMHPPR
jgi:hypothetical protein